MPGYCGLSQKSPRDYRYAVTDSLKGNAEMEHLKNQKRNYLFRGIAAALLTVLFVSLTVNIFHGNDAILNYIEETVSAVEHGAVTVSYAENEDRYSLTAEEEGYSFRVMQLSDIHLTCGYATYAEDCRAVNTIYTLVKEVKPDLIVLSGDSVSPIVLTGSTINTSLTARALAALFTKMQIPWTLVYGNHDDEGLASKSDLSAYFMSVPGCLFRQGDPEADGEGNSVITLLNADKTLAQAVFFMDSHGSLTIGYDNVHENQIAWYKSELASLRNEYGNVPSVLYMHIPPEEYKTLNSRYLSGDPGVSRLYGTIRHRIAAGRNHGLYQALLEGQSTKYVFFGHDHTNSAGYRDAEDGILLSYTPSIDFSTYVSVHFRSEQRGCTYLDIAPDGGVTVTQLYIDTLLAESGR